MFPNNKLKLKIFMQKLLNKYDDLRGKPIDSSKGPFWDAILISASDASQLKGYKLQIDEKNRKGELPKFVPIHVLCDPPGYKIGCGGSTMHLLDWAFTIYGSEMQTMRFLVIPAGGYSQRLPNLTVLGKLFSPLPFGEQNYQMLDLILACYIPFLKHMPPGVLIASSDAIISFDLLENDSWTFENEGFTALAHPSPLDIGTTHGVYVLPTIANVENKSTIMSECLRVLQKPTLEEMYENGAVIKAYSSSGNENKMDIIFSDSVFFFNHSITKKLLKFYKNNKPLKCELSSYGDFLQALGSNANPSYIVNKTRDESVALMQSALYRELFGTKLSVLVLMNSHFHHLGTMEEYVESLCGKNKFSEVFPMSKNTFSAFSVCQVPSLYIDGTVIHSVVHPLSVIPESSVVEYCDFSIGLNIGSNCIISNVQLPGHSVQRLQFRIPDNTLLHTVFLQNDSYVTVAFDIREDIKQVRERTFIPEISFFSRKLKTFLRRKDDVDVPIFEDSLISLWNAKLFLVCSSPGESALSTLQMLAGLTDVHDELCNYTLYRTSGKWVSMKDILALKSVENLADYHRILYEKIQRLKI